MKTPLLVFSVALLFANSAWSQTEGEGQGLPLVFSEDFQSGRDKWETTDDKSWEFFDEAGRSHLD